ncbi:hypothetical protein NEAUS05_0695 [Nematocida ausubeli]|nr:hypothetical protein NEAUS05_0695 [Nematocida ausubeli]
MNPFESVKSGYVDPDVLSCFSLVQKKDVNTRCKALQRIVNSLDTLSADCVAQCLYDTMPVLCKNAQEPIPTYVSMIFLSILKNSSRPLQNSSASHWVHMFLDHPHKVGYKVIKHLSKSQALVPLLAFYNRTACVEMYIKSKLVESAVEKTVDVSIEMIKKAKTGSEIGRLAKLLCSLEEKQQLSSEIKEAALCAASAAQGAPERWKVFAAVNAGYTVEDVIKDSSKMEDEAFLAIVSSERFRKEVSEYGPALFVEGCANLPAILFSVLLEITNNRKLILKKMFQSNTSGFEHIKIEKSDFPYLNTIDCYNRVNEALQAHPIHSTKVYEELTFRERIIRADMAGEKIEDISREMISQISIGFLKKEGIFEEGVRVLPRFFFKDQEELGKEEHIYVATEHPSLTTRQTIDLMFKYKLFIEKILRGLPDDLMVYLMSKIESEPMDVIQEVYELVRDKIEQKYAMKLLGRIYTTAPYTKEDFTKKFVLTEDIEESYLIYLIEKEAIDENSVYEYIIQDANRNAAGTNDISDECIELTEVIEGAETKQPCSAYLFVHAFSKWKSTLTRLKNAKLSGFLQSILEIQSILPAAAEIEESFGSIRVDGLVGRVVDAMRFWKDVSQKRVPSQIATLIIQAEEDTTEPSTEKSALAKDIIEAYVQTLFGNTVESNVENKLADVTLDSLPSRNRGALVYLLLRIEKSTGKKTLNLSFKEAQRIHCRVLSLAIQNSTSFQGIEDIDFSLVNQEDLRHMQPYLERHPEKAAVYIKSDRAWAGEAGEHRSEAYRPILKSIAKHYANSVLNVYSMSKVEEGAIDAEIFYMLFDIPAIGNIKNMDAYEWRLFLSICSEIRTIELSSLISAMVRAECKWLSFLISSEANALDLLGLFARSFPVLLRLFFKSSRNTKRVQRYFVQNVTPRLIRDEASRPLQGVEIRMKTIAEIHIMVVVYKIEESELEVNINFPKDYPLSIPEVKIIRCVGVKKQRLQRLLLRIQMLMAEHCRVGEALVLWKLALDKAVDEVEECGICFFMVNEVSKSFPDTTCSKCSNQFHGLCLKTWLQRSKNQCPICREEISS